jgi:tetratricopeptide (TPR) repeat protein
MRSSHSIVRGLLLAAAVVLTSAGSLRAQYGQPQQQNPPTPPPAKQPGTPAPPAAPAVNKEEEDTYKKFFETKASADQIPLGEDFLKKFPESRYRESVYSKLTADYLANGMEDKMFAAGEKTLELDPDNVDVLAVMAMTIPRRVDIRALDADQKLNKAENYGKKAIGLIGNLQKPATITDEDFAKAKNEKLSMAHSGLGFVYFHRGKYMESAAEFGEATKLASAPDPADFYVMGYAYEQAKKFDDAVTAYGKCGDIAGPLQARCKSSQTNAKKAATAQPKP